MEENYVRCFVVFTLNGYISSQMNLFCVLGDKFPMSLFT